MDQLSWRLNEGQMKDWNIKRPTCFSLGTILSFWPWTGQNQKFGLVFLPQENTQKRRYVGFFNCASLNFRKWSGNQSKWVKLKTGSSVIRQKQTHADPISGTVKQVFFLARKELASTKPPPRSQIWANICCTIYFPNENPWV